MNPTLSDGAAKNIDLCVCLWNNPGQYVVQLSGPKVSVVNTPTRLALIIVVLLAPGVTYAWEGKVIAVDRADQIQVMKDIGKVETVRLYGIDSPGAPQPFGETARLYTHKRVCGKDRPSGPTNCRSI